MNPKVYLDGVGGSEVGVGIMHVHLLCFPPTERDGKNKRRSVLGQQFIVSVNGRRILRRPGHVRDSAYACPSNASSILSRRDNGLFAHGSSSLVPTNYFSSMSDRVDAVFNSQLPA